MSSWPTCAKATVDKLDWIEDKITCPFCGEEFQALFCEDGNPNREPIVITTLAGNKTVCPSCTREIKEDEMHKEKTNLIL